MSRRVFDELVRDLLCVTLVGTFGVVVLMMVLVSVASAAEQPRQAIKTAPQSTNDTVVDPKLVAAIRKAAMSGKKPCPCQHGGASK